MPTVFPYRILARRLPPATLVLALLLAGLATAAPVTPPSLGAPTEVSAVTLRQDVISVPVDGVMTFGATIVVDRPTSYLESRLQVRRPEGRLLYQKTEVRSDLATSTITIDYERQLADLELAPGVYPVELRVRTQSDDVREWVVNDHLLVHATNPTKVPVSVIAYICSSPATDADGRFSIDPASSVRARDDAEALANWVLESPGRRLTLAVPGFLLEEWARAARGYQVATPEGVREIAAGDGVPGAYARALDTIARAAQTGRLEMASGTYASPDVGALQEGVRLQDIEDHVLRGHSAHVAVLGDKPSPTLVLPNGRLPREGLDAITGIGVSSYVVSPESIETTTPSGAYRSEDSTELIALVTDARVESSLRSSETSTLALSIFERSTSEEASAPVVARITLGPGQPASSADVLAAMGRLTGAPWLEFVTAADAADRPGSDRVSLVQSVDPLPAAPANFWAETGEARAYAEAFLEAVGVNDPEAQQASDLSLMAQSGSWAGPDLNWGSAERGRSLAAASRRISGSVLDSIVLEASDITLSGTGGGIPVSIVNSSVKNLVLSLRTRSSGLAVGESMPTTQQVRPQENIVTVPVDLGQSLSGRLTVDILADDILLDTVTVTVRASFLDRLVIVIAVAVVLAGMLLYIRRRIHKTGGAATIPQRGTAPTGETE